MNIKPWVLAVFKLRMLLAAFKPKMLTRVKARKLARTKLRMLPKSKQKMMARLAKIKQETPTRIDKDTVQD